MKNSFLNTIVKNNRVIPIVILSLLTPLSLSSNAYADKNTDLDFLTAQAWNNAIAQGNSELVAAQTANNAALKFLSEGKYPSFELENSKKAKKYVDGWIKAKKSKLSDALASKKSGFTSEVGKPGEIFALKKGIGAWNTAKKNKLSDSVAAKSFSRAVWDATITVAAIAMTDDSSIEKLRNQVNDWNSKKK